jgi:hypothetical protein
MSFKGGYFSANESEADEPEQYYLRLLNENNQEMGQLRSDSLQSLKNIANQIVSQRYSQSSYP